MLCSCRFQQKEHPIPELSRGSARSHRQKQLRETNKKKKTRAGAHDCFSFFLIFFCSTLSNTACTGITHGGLLPSAFCVQRLSNGEILQFIPLIALCCVLHRYGKPSHPSRHVLGSAPRRVVRREKKKGNKRQGRIPSSSSSSFLVGKKEKGKLRFVLCLGCVFHLPPSLPPSLTTGGEGKGNKDEKKVWCGKSFRKNDPAAGSPTATLLRLLLPLLKKYR